MGWEIQSVWSLGLTAEKQLGARGPGLPRAERAREGIPPAGLQEPAWQCGDTDSNRQTTCFQLRE